MQYKGKIEYKPSSDDDPIPYWAALYEDEQFVNGVYCASREDARTALDKMKSDHLSRPPVEWVDLGNAGGGGRREVLTVVEEPRDFT